MSRSAGWRHGGIALLALVLLAGPAEAQRRRWGALPDKDPDFKEFNVPYTGLVTFVRLRYTPDEVDFGNYFFGADYGWNHDYDRADRNLMTLLRELTSVSVQGDGGNILSALDPELFKYPVAYMAEPGHWTVTDDEAAALRAYLRKGGFIIFDDFAGYDQFFRFQECLRKVLPDGRLLQLDATHPIFHSFFEIDTLDFLHPYYGMEASFFGVFEDNDPTRRLLLIANVNNDVGESWEWSTTGFIPIDITNRAFRLGVNYLIYALSH